MSFEQRWHPLREQWIVVAAHRQRRPWVGEREVAQHPALPEIDPKCSFCPGNRRAGGQLNPQYDGIWVFDNDHPCVDLEAPRELETPAGFYRNRPADGVARVVCYTARHDLSLSRLPVAQVDALLACWQRQVAELRRLDSVRHVLLFENRGAEVGVSNPHPHGQIYATNFVFPTTQREVDAGRRHGQQHGRVLFQDVLAAEHADGRRILAERPHAVAFVPYFARWAYEVYVAPRQTYPDVQALPDEVRRDVAAVLHDTLVRFDNLWQRPFPYVLAVHQAPMDGEEHPEFHFHIELHPPLRTPGLRKFLAGPEIGGGGFLADTSAEEKAAELRVLSGVHYLGAPSEPS